MSTGILVLTDKALQGAIKLKNVLDKTTIYAPIKLKKVNSEEKNHYKANHDNVILFYDIKFSQCVYDAYHQHDKLIFIMATGIVVRTISPYIKDKAIDPAVVVLDENLKFCISLIGGHVAGANELALEISGFIGCTPVITTATDVNNKGALDIIAKKLNAYNNAQRDLYKTINYELASFRTVYLVSDFDISKLDIDIRGFKQIDFYQALDLSKTDYLIHLRGAYKDNKDQLEQIKKITNYHEIKPGKLVLGIGCRRNTSFQKMIEGLDELCCTYLIDKNAIKIIASIDIKKDELGILELAKDLNCEFITVDQNVLNDIVLESDSIKTSEFVQKTVGAGSVSEASAYYISKGQIILPKQVINGITYALGIINY